MGLGSMVLNKVRVHVAFSLVLDTDLVRCCGGYQVQGAMETSARVWSV